MAFWCIDPINGSDATGNEQPTQAEAEQTPFRTWASVTWTPGDTYLQRRGTTALEEVIVGRTGEADARITLDAYGETGDMPVIDGEGNRDNCVRLNGKSYVTVRNLRLVRANAAGCLHILGNDDRGPDGVIAEDLVCSQNASGGGITLDNEKPAAARDVIIRRCQADDNGASGIRVGGTLDGVLVDRCTVRRNGYATNHWGIHTQAHQTKFARGEWTRIANWIYEVELPPGETAITISITQSSFDYRRMRPGNFTALNPNEFAQSGTTLRLNVAEDLSLHNSNFPIRVLLGRLRNVIVQDCVSEDQLAFNHNDGTGMGFDTFTEDSEFRRCTVIRAAKQGFSLNDTDGNMYLVGCEVNSCGLDTFQAYGAYFGARGGAGTRQFINCTAIGSANAAFRFQDDTAAGTQGSYEVHNVLAENCAYGLAEAVTRTALNYSGVVLHNVGTPGFASFTSSPVSNLATLTSPFLLAPGATAIGRGSVRTVPDPRDRRGVYRLTQDCGASYYVTPAPSSRNPFP